MDPDSLAAAASPNAVLAIVRRSDGRYLLIRRADSRPAGGWWTPVTGRLEPGEALESAVVREVLEEVGLAVQVLREERRGTTADGRWRLVWFETALVDDRAAFEPLRLAADEVAEARWCLPEEALRLAPMFDAHRRFFGELLGR